MSSGEFLAMTEPTSLFGLVKYSVTGVAGGVTYSVAAIETNPAAALAVTPDLNTSILALALAIIGYAMKVYMPSEKRVDSQFEVLKVQHQTLFDRLEAMAFESHEDAKERREHYAMLHKWMGGVDNKLTSLNENSIDARIRMDGVMGRLARIERGQRDSGEIRKP